MYRNFYLRIIINYTKMKYSKNNLNSNKSNRLDFLKYYNTAQLTQFKSTLSSSFSKVQRNSIVNSSQKQQETVTVIQNPALNQKQFVSQLKNQTIQQEDKQCQNQNFHYQNIQKVLQEVDQSQKKIQEQAIQNYPKVQKMMQRLTNLHLTQSNRYWLLCRLKVFYEARPKRKHSLWYYKRLRKNIDRRSIRIQELISFVRGSDITKQEWCQIFSYEKNEKGQIHDLTQTEIDFQVPISQQKKQSKNFVINKNDQMLKLQILTPEQKKLAIQLRQRLKNIAKISIQRLVLEICNNKKKDFYFTGYIDNIAKEQMKKIDEQFQYDKVFQSLCEKSVTINQSKRYLAIKKATKSERPYILKQQ